MSSEGWKESKLGEVATVTKLAGFEFTKHIKYIDDGEIIAIRALNVRDGFFDLTDIKRIDKAVSDNLIRSKLFKDDIVLTYTGANFGEVAIVNENDRFHLAPNVSKVTIKEGMDPYFYYSYFRSAKFRGQLRSYGVGSSQPTIPMKIIRELSVPIPPVKEQRAISSIILGLDEKIKLNNTIKENLEKMVQTLFKRWFVDFEFPNENREPYKLSGGDFEESELGLIPKGWRVGTLSDLGEVVGGATPSKSKQEYYTTWGIPWITPKDLSRNKNKYISRGQIDITEEGFKSSSTKLVPKGTVLFSSRAPIGYIAISKNEMTTNQGFKSLIPFEHIRSEFLYCVLKFNTETIESRASGSTFKEISGSEMKRVPVIIPPFDVIGQFSIIVESIGQMVEKCESEIDSLIELRDSLLSKLMSGEIRVPLKQEYSNSQMTDLPLAAENKAQYSAT